MEQSPFRERRFGPAEVRRILRRAAEVAERDAGTPSAERSLTQKEVEHLGGELGLPPTSIRSAIASDAHSAGDAPGLLTTRRRVVFEEDIDGELPASHHEDIVEAIQIVTGHPGHSQVVGRTLTWTPTPSTIRNQPRQLTISVRPRDGRTRLRIDESLTEQFLGLHLGFGFGLGFGLGGAAFAVGMAAGRPLLGAALALMLVVGGLLLAHVIYRTVLMRRTRELAALRTRLDDVIHEGIAAKSAAGARARIGEPDAEAEAEAEAAAEEEAVANARAP